MTSVRTFITDSITPSLIYGGVMTSDIMDLIHLSPNIPTEVMAHIKIEIKGGSWGRGLIQSLFTGEVSPHDTANITLYSDKNVAFRKALADSFTIHLFPAIIPR